MNPQIPPAGQPNPYPYPVPPYPQPPHPYVVPVPFQQFPLPQAIPAPPPAPFDFAEEEETPRRRRNRRKSSEESGNRGLIIALVVMAAIAIGWFGFISLRNEWDAQRLPVIREKIWRGLDELDRLGGPLLDRAGNPKSPAVQKLYDEINDLYEEYRTISRRHPDWNIPPAPRP